jgi:hypothetical protein
VTPIAVSWDAKLKHTNVIKVDPTKLIRSVVIRVLFNDAMSIVA